MEEVLKIDTKRVFVWSFIAGIGFTLGEAIISTPVHLLSAWMQVTYFGG